MLAHEVGPATRTTPARHIRVSSAISLCQGAWRSVSTG